MTRFYDRWVRITATVLLLTTVLAQSVLAFDKCQDDIGATCLPCSVAGSIFMPDNVSSGTDTTVPDPSKKHAAFDINYFGPHRENDTKFWIRIEAKGGGLSQPVKICYTSPTEQSPPDEYSYVTTRSWASKTAVSFRNGAYGFKGGDIRLKQGSVIVVYPNGREMKIEHVGGETIVTDGTRKQYQQFDVDGRPLLLEEFRIIGQVEQPVSATYWTYTEDAFETVVRTRVTKVSYSSDGGKRYHTTIYAYYSGSSAIPVDKRGKLYFTVEPDGVRRYLVNGHLAQGIDSAQPGDACALDDPAVVSDAVLKDLASAVYLDYDVESRPLEVQNQGDCGACGGGGGMTGTTTYAYGVNGDYGTPDPEDIPTTWKSYRRTTAPSGLRKVEFFNAYMQPVFVVTQAEVGGNRLHWVTHNLYDAQGRLVERRSPSACALASYGVETADPNLWPTDVSPNDGGTDGQVDIYVYDVNHGEQTAQKIRKGTGGTTYWVRKMEYGAETTYNDITVYRVTAETTYPTLTTDENAADRLVTTYDYTYYQDGLVNTHAVAFERVMYPAVPTSQNGSGSATFSIRHYHQDLTKNLYYNDWTLQEDGALSFTRLNDDGSTEFAVEDAKTDGSGNLVGETGIQSPDDPWTTVGPWVNTSGAGFKTAYTYDVYGRMATMTDPSGLVRVTVHAHQKQTVTDGGVTRETTTSLVTLSAAHKDGANKYDYVPLQIHVADMAGHSIISATGLPTTGTDGNLTNDWNAANTTLDTAFAGTITSRSETFYNDGGQMTSSVVWTDADDAQQPKYTTSYSYDANTGRLDTTTAPDGTITKRLYDVLGRVNEVKRGVGAQNLLTISRIYFDGADDTMPIKVGAGNVTQSRTYYDTGVNDYYTTISQYDWRNRPIQSRGQDKLATSYTLDNLGRATVVESYYDADDDMELDAGELRGKSETFYDPKGQVYKTTAYEVADNGTVGHSLTSLTWYDATGRTIKTRDANGLFSKTRYDSAGRAVASYISFDANEQDTEYAKADDVEDDTVIEQSLVSYDDATSGGHQQWLSRSFQRRDNVASGGGELTPANARVTYAVSWYDLLGRPIKSVTYGTNGSAGNEVVIDDKNDDFNSDEAGSLAYSTGGPAVNTSTAYIVATTEYDARGQAYKFIDNAGKQTRLVFDDLGRTVSTIENYVNGTLAETETDTDRITQTIFDTAGRLWKLVAYNPKGAGNGVEEQITTYLYKSAFSGALQTNVIYPDSADTDETGTDQVKMTHDRLGRVLTKTDQNGTVHTYSFTPEGRFAADAVTTLGTNVDGAVRRIQRTYDDRGRTVKITSYDAATAGNIVNEVQQTYTDTGGNFGAMTKSHQSHDGAVAGGTPEVNYAYTDGTTGAQTEAQHLRLATLTYPNGRVLHYNYPASGTIGHMLSRIDNLANDASGTTKFAQYGYFGAASVYKIDHPAVDSGNGLTLNYDTNSDHLYQGLDRFGRVVTQKWTPGSGSTAYQHINHDYDKASNRKYAHNPTYPSASQVYSYDGLDRLNQYKAGQIKSDKSDTELFSTRHGQKWTLDELGNHRQVDDGRNGSWAGHRIAAVNTANELTSSITRATMTRSLQLDNFASNTSADWTKPGANDAFTIGGGVLKTTAVAQDTIEGEQEEEARVVLTWGSAKGPANIWLGSVRIPAGAPDSGCIGIVFGYKSPSNYWIRVLDYAADQMRIYHVINGVKGSAISSYAMTLTPGTWYQSWTLTYNPRRGTLANGWPSGKVGLYSTVVDAEFKGFCVLEEFPPLDSAGRWDTHTTSWADHTGSAFHASSDRLRVHAAPEASLEPYLLRGARFQRFQATFSSKRWADPPGDWSWTQFLFHFNAQDADHYDCLAFQLYPTGHNSAPYGYRLHDGTPSQVQSGTRINANMPGVTDSDIVWVRIQQDGTNLTVRSRIDNTGTPTENDWSNTAACYTSTAFSSSSGGMIGFSGGHNATAFDRLILKTDGNEDGDFDDVEDKIQIVEHFSADAGGYAPQGPTHDAAGNLTYDGVYAFTFDSWNRLAKVTNAWREATDDGQGGVTLGDIQHGSIVQESQYDGLGRRIVKEVKNSADLNCTYHYYYGSASGGDGWSILETRDNTGNTLKQQVWGLTYIDELVQIGLNDDPADHTDGPEEDQCLVDSFFYPMQDANYNVLGVVNADGVLVERYEYTPYGKRTVYFSPGTNDPDCYAPTNISRRWTPGTGGNPGTLGPTGGPYGLCEFGFTGKVHDEDTGLMYFNYRMYDPRLGRFQNRDPIEYPDGLNAYAGYFAMHSRTDAYGLAMGADPLNAEDSYLMIVANAVKEGGPAAVRQTIANLNLSKEAAAAILQTVYKTAILTGAGVSLANLTGDAAMSDAVMSATALIAAAQHEAAQKSLEAIQKAWGERVRNPCYCPCLPQAAGIARQSVIIFGAGAGWVTEGAFSSHIEAAQYELRYGINKAYDIIDAARKAAKKPPAQRKSHLNELRQSCSILRRLMQGLSSCVAAQPTCNQSPYKELVLGATTVGTAGQGACATIGF